MEGVEILGVPIAEGITQSRVQVRHRLFSPKRKQKKSYKRY